MYLCITQRSYRKAEDYALDRGGGNELGGKQVEPRCVSGAEPTRLSCIEDSGSPLHRGQDESPSHHSPPSLYSVPYFKVACPLMLPLPAYFSISKALKSPFSILTVLNAQFSSTSTFAWLCNHHPILLQNFPRI